MFESRGLATAKLNKPSSSSQTIHLDRTLKLLSYIVSYRIVTKKHQVDRTTGCGHIATLNFSNMVVAAILDLGES